MMCSLQGPNRRQGQHTNEVGTHQSSERGLNFFTSVEAHLASELATVGVNLTVVSKDSDFRQAEEQQARFVGSGKTLLGVHLMVRQVKQRTRGDGPTKGR